MKNKEMSLIENETAPFGFLGFSVLVVCKYTLNRINHWSCECDLHFCQHLKLGARGEDNGSYTGQ